MFSVTKCVRSEHDDQTFDIYKAFRSRFALSCDNTNISFVFSCQNFHKWRTDMAGSSNDNNDRFRTCTIAGFSTVAGCATVVRFCRCTRTTMARTRRARTRSSSHLLRSQTRRGSKRIKKKQESVQWFFICLIFHSAPCSRALIDACTTCPSSLAKKKRNKTRMKRTQEKIREEEGKCEMKKAEQKRIGEWGSLKSTKKYSEQWKTWSAWNKAAWLRKRRKRNH